MNNKERMAAGLVYDPADDTIVEEQMRCLELLYDYNATRPSETEKRRELLERMFGAIGENCYIEPPFHANWGGKHVYFGDNVYANFGLTLVDDVNIYVGDRVKFGPGVVVATAGHPIMPELRRLAYQFNKEVHIGSNVWIGARSVILPGVTIGDNSVIGAGSVVTKDVPANVVAYGVPCRVVREICDRDKLYFYRNERIDWDELAPDMKPDLTEK